MSRKTFKYTKPHQKHKRKSFSCYAPQCDYLKSLMKRLVPKSSHPKDRSFTSRDNLAFGAEHIHDFGRTTDCHLTVNEIDWEDRGRPTVFIDSKYLVEMMYKAKLDIVPESLVVPGGLVAFAFPEGLVIDGIKVNGCLFGEMKLQEYRDKCIEELKPYFGGDITFENQEFLKGNTDCQSIYLVCMGKHSYIEDMPAHLRLWFKKEDSVNIVNEGWVEENLLNEEFVKDEEYKLQRVMFRICYSLCIYMSAFPDAIKNGFPEDFAQERMYRQKIPHPNTVLVHGILGTHASPHAHFRTWHFRSLTSERYRRNPDGSIKVVFVRSSIVNRDKIAPE